MTYELFYSYGGHGGPYQSLEHARAAAEAMLESFPRHSIDIRPRVASGIGGYGDPVATVYGAEYPGRDRTCDVERATCD